MGHVAHEWVIQAHKDMNESSRHIKQAASKQEHHMQCKHQGHDAFIWGMTHSYEAWRIDSRSNECVKVLDVTSWLIDAWHDLCVLMRDMIYVEPLTWRMSHTSHHSFIRHTTHSYVTPLKHMSHHFSQVLVLSTVAKFLSLPTPSRRLGSRWPPVGGHQSNRHTDDSTDEWYWVHAYQWYTHAYEW